MNETRTSEEMIDLRLRILEYIRNNDRAHFFNIAMDLNLHSDTLARELKILMDKGFLVAYEGGYYSITREGLEELDRLKGDQLAH